MRAALGLGLALVLGAATLPAQQMRDNTTRRAPETTTTATAALAGIVRSDAGTPVRAAIVTLAGGDLASSRAVVTDDEGRFAFERLPAGRFTLSAKKAAYVTMAYGATRPGRSGTAIAVASGQRVDVALTLPRGSVITGRVVDTATGAPAPDVGVFATRTDVSQPATGSPFVALPVTDDRGVFRLFGLEPGEYVIAAVPQQVVTGDIDTRAEADVDAILAALQQRSRTPGTTSKPAAVPVAPRPRTAGYAPIYHPGTATRADAARVRVAAGEERQGIDIAMSLVRTATIEGVVSAGQGSLPPLSMVITSDEPSRGPTLMGVSSPSLVPPGPDGRFRYMNVPPGRYTITARSNSSPARAGGPGPRGVTTSQTSPASTDLQWAATAVVVDGDDVAGLTLVLQPALKLTGRMITDAPSPRALPDAAKARVWIVQDGAGGTTVIDGTAMGRVPVPPARIQDDGTFEIDGVLPGAYRLNVTLPEGTWRLRSAIVDGRDVLDYPLTFSDGDRSGATLIFSERRASLSGTVQDTDGRPVLDLAVVVVPADTALWRADSRRVRTTRPATDGTFTFDDLVPGDYLLAALTDFDPADLRSDAGVVDPAFAQQFAASSIKVSVGDGEQKRQDVRVGR
jgi:protocatechuate 3,4-dioxygenase beta subunit